jgi:hypothetical protein
VASSGDDAGGNWLKHQSCHPHDAHRGSSQKREAWREAAKGFSTALGFIWKSVRAARVGWRFKYRIDGVEKRVSPGVYPDITLKRARERCQDARRLIAERIDPSAQRKAEKAAVQDTFEALAREYFA